MRHVLESSAEHGVVHRLLGRLPPQEAVRARRRLRRLSRPARLGNLRRTTPLSDEFGYDRGTPIDRYYIEQFLWENRGCVHGRVLEVKDSTYTDQFGNGVTGKDVLDIDAENPLVTIVADLATPNVIPDASFDCFILTQTLQYIYEARTAIAHAHRILKPAGALLATVPAVSPIVDENHLTDYWRFTPESCTALFGEIFGHESIRVRAYGNVLTAIAFLAGMAHEELTGRELAVHDSRFAMLISVNAVKR
jgi:SAM-dependent methyltransferase